MGFMHKCIPLYFIPMHTKFEYLNIYLYKSFYASAFVIEVLCKCVQPQFAFYANIQIIKYTLQWSYIRFIKQNACIILNYKEISVFRIIANLNHWVKISF